MKAYLETIVVTQSSMQCNVNTSVSQVILEFEDHDKFIMFKDTLDAHEKAPGFEVYRTMMPIY